MAFASIKRFKARVQGHTPVPRSLLRAAETAYAARLPKKAGWAAAFRVNAMVAAEQALNKRGVIDPKKREIVMKTCMKVFNRKRQLERELSKMEMDERAIPRSLLTPEQREKIESDSRGTHFLRYTYYKYGKNSLAGRLADAERKPLVAKYESLMRNVPKQIVSVLGKRKDELFWDDLQNGLNVDETA